MTVTSPRTGAVPSRTSATAARAAAGLPSARQITARALRISPELARSSSNAAITARAWPALPRRGWGARGQRGRAAELEVGAADMTGQVGALPQVAFGVRRV